MRLKLLKCQLPCHPLYHSSHSSIHFAHRPLNSSTSRFVRRVTSRLFHRARILSLVLFNCVPRSILLSFFSFLLFHPLSCLFAVILALTVTSGRKLNLGSEPRLKSAPSRWKKRDHLFHDYIATPNFISFRLNLWLLVLGKKFYSF